MGGTLVGGGMMFAGVGRISTEQLLDPPLAGSSVGKLPSLAMKIPTSQRSGAAKLTVRSRSKITGVPLTQEVRVVVGARVMPVILTSLAVQPRSLPNRVAAQAVAG